MQETTATLSASVTQYGNESRAAGNGRTWSRSPLYRLSIAEEQETSFHFEMISVIDLWVWKATIWHVIAEYYTYSYGFYYDLHKTGPWVILFLQGYSVHTSLYHYSGTFGDNQYGCPNIYQKGCHSCYLDTGASLYLTCCTSFLCPSVVPPGTVWLHWQQSFNIPFGSGACPNTLHLQEE